MSKFCKRMKFPRPRTLIEAMYPTLFINRIFGVGVIEYPIGRPRRIISGFWSVANFLIYFGFLRMANLSGLVKFQESKIAASNHRLNAYSCAVFVATSMILSQIKAKELRDIFPKIIYINDRLYILGIPHDHELLFKAQIVYLAGGFIWMFTIMALDFGYIGFDFPSASSRLGFLLASHYSLIFGFIMDGSFNGSIRYFHNRFQRLNALLVESISPEKSKTTVTKKSDEKFPRYPSVIDEIHLSNSLAIRASDQFWLLYIIREAKKIHRGLCKTAMELNTALGIQVLFSIALAFGLITTLLYSTYFGVMTSLWNDPILGNWMILVIIPLMWIGFYALKVLLLVNACEITTGEANRTGRLIIELLDTPACDEDIRDQINIFLLELIQNPLTFTASGFFTLDYSLIRGMIGSVTTYLIIMIQMRSTYERETLNSTRN